MMMNTEYSNRGVELMVLAIVGIMLLTIITMLDGDEVDISKLDTYNYVVTVDSESKSIYLTEKGFWDWGQVIRVK